MDPESITLLKQVALIIAVCLGVFAAWLKLRDAAQTESQRKRTRDWYGHKWEVIRASRALEIPEIVINWLLAVKGRFEVTLDRWEKRLSSHPPPWLFLALAIGVSATGIDAFLRHEYLWSIFFIVSSIVLCVLSRLFRKRDPATDRWGPLLSFTFCVLRLLTGFSLILTDGRLPVKVALSLPFAALFVGGFLVIRWWSHMPFLAGRSRDFLRASVFYWVALSAAISPSITLIAMLIGSVAAPTSHVPQTVQMLIVNAICDGATLIVTWRILSHAVDPGKKLSIPIAVALDVAIAAILASVALWFGLVFTEHSLTIREVLNVLIARRPDGAGLEIGPYFWVMHSTFLPTLAYLSLIALCWLGALIVRPAAWLFRTGSKVEHPHGLSVALLTFLAAIFLGIRALLP